LIDNIYPTPSFQKKQNKQRKKGNKEQYKHKPQLDGLFYIATIRQTGYLLYLLYLEMCKPWWQLKLKLK